MTFLLLCMGGMPFGASPNGMGKCAKMYLVKRFQKRRKPLGWGPEMQRKDEGRPENRNLWSYGQFLEWHILQNTRPEPVAPEIRWTFKTFSDAIDVDDRYLRFWRSGHVLPSERSREHIERALFGT